jgi:hypothetical protein
VQFLRSARKSVARREDERRSHIHTPLRAPADERCRERHIRGEQPADTSEWRQRQLAENELVSELARAGHAHRAALRGHEQPRREPHVGAWHSALRRLGWLRFGAPGPGQERAEQVDAEANEHA